MGTNRVMANSTAISKVMGSRVATVATRATAIKAMASNMDMVMSSKAMDMASNKVMGTASHNVMAMAATRAMDNMVAMVVTKVMVIKAVMVAIRAMVKVGTVATKAMAVSLIRVTANKATVPNRDTANKVMGSRRDMVRTKVTAINKAVMATASSKVTQGALTELTTDLTSHAPTMIRVMGSKATMVATRAMDSKEAI